MTLRAAILDLLDSGPMTFPELNAHIGAKPAALAFARLRAYDAGLITRSGTRRHYVYTKVEGEPVRPAPRPRAQGTTIAPAAPDFQVPRGASIFDLA